MLIHTRSEWRAAPPKRFTSRKPDSFEGTVIHWFGSPKMSGSHAGCPALLRSVQRAHLMNKKENYSDIAYSLAVCPHGHVYELRGIYRQGGANGTAEANEKYISVVYMAGVGDPLTGPAQRALSDTLRFLWRQGVGKVVKPHGEITGSACPGPELTKWIEEKKWVTPPPKLPGPKPLLVDVTAEAFVLEAQPYDSPAVHARIKRALKSGQTVTIKLADGV